MRIIKYWSSNFHNIFYIIHCFPAKSWKFGKKWDSNPQRKALYDCCILISMFYWFQCYPLCASQSPTKSIAPRLVNSDIHLTLPWCNSDLAQLDRNQAAKYTGSGCHECSHWLTLIATQTLIKMGCIELCGGVHTAQIPTQTKTTINYYWTHFCHCRCCIGVRQCECTIKGSALIW